ncbi:MAG: hypothetical protein GY862_05395 [Gammaproteobacteria bacterium]|nr:hypothetical protein [Gammaproteobacteria bacterium]
MLFITSPSMNRTAPFGCSFILFRLLCTLIMVSVILLLFSLPAQAMGPFVKVPWNENPPLRPPADVGTRSTPFLADIDNDGDLDAFIGAYDGTVHYYENTGSTTGAVFTERTDTANPLGEVDVEQSSVPFLADIDNDGDLDAFIGAGGKVSYYENTGSTNRAIFTERTGTNPLGWISSYYYMWNDLVPFLADIDNDGDLDAFIGAGGKVSYYENTGSAVGPIFTRSYTYNPLDGVNVGQLFLVDMDNDGDLDAFIGTVKVQEDDATVRYYKNTGSADRAVFTEYTDTTANPLGGIDMKYAYAAPFLADMDNDGDLDAFIGAHDGVTRYYENTGDTEEAVFMERTDTANPLGGMYVGQDNKASPFLADIDNDGDLDVFIGSWNNSTTHYYENIGRTDRPVFTRRTGTANPLEVVEGRNILFLADMDNDGDLDAFINSVDNMVDYYENTGSADRAVFTKRTGTANPLDGISSYHTCLADMDNDGDLDAFVGTAGYYENTGSADKAVFTKRTDTANPLSGADAGNVPFLADMDNDGDLDAFIGADITVYYYENTGNAGGAVFTKRTDTANPLGGVFLEAGGSIPFLADIDNDGDLDAFIGAFDGKVHYYKNTASMGGMFFTERTDTANPLAGVEIGFNYVPSLADMDNDGDLDAFIGTNDGTVYYYENTGNADGPVFTQRTNTGNPLGGIDVGSDSAPFLADMNNDGDLDVFIGFLTYFENPVRYYENMGNATEPVFPQRMGTVNPLAGLDAYASFLADMDNDGDLDAFIRRFNTLRYYENTGNATRAVFTKHTDTANFLGGMEDVDSYRAPFLADMERDGDLDAFIGAKDGMVYYYENTGSASRPIFTERTDTANPLVGIDVGDDSVPFLADMDNDGDLDAFIGSPHNAVHYYENTGNAGKAVFTERMDTANPLGEVEVGYLSAPFLADIDKDGDLDAFIGEGDGIVHYYENTGNADEPVFTQRTDTANPLDGMGVGNYSAPFLADMDNDGDLDAFIGALYDMMRYYENTGNAAEPVFTQHGDMVNPLDGVGANNASFLADLDNDGDLDAFIGRDDGTVHYYENTGNAAGPVFIQRTDMANPLGGMDVGDDSAPFLTDMDRDSDLDAFVGSSDGTVRYYENTGSASGPVFTERTGTANPLGRVDVLNDSVPFLADIDNDGDLDAFIAGNSTMHYYVNTSAGGNVLPEYYALPGGGNYNGQRRISLNCPHCNQGERIYYATTRTPLIEYITGQPIEISTTTTLKFMIIDAEGNPGTVYTETYIIDNEPPVIDITSPSGNDTVAGITEIQGTVFDTGGSVFDRVELQIFSDPLYFKGENKATLITDLTWLLVSRNTAELRRTGQWTYPIDDNLFPVGTYRITARAFDRVGNVTEVTRTVYKAGQAPADLSLERNTPTLVNPADQVDPIGNKAVLNVKGRLTSRRFPALDENLTGLPIALSIYPPQCDPPDYAARDCEAPGDAGCEIPGCASTAVIRVHSDLGQYEFLDLGQIPPPDDYTLQGPFDGFTQAGTYTLQAHFTGTPLLTPAVSLRQTVLVGRSAGYALIIQGKTAGEEGLASHNKTANRIYKKFLERGFEKENIFYFNYEPGQDVDGNGFSDDIAGIPGGSIAGILPELQSRINGSPAPFYLVLVDHGDREGHFYLENDTVRPEDISAFLQALEDGLSPKARELPRVAVLGYCFSGSAIPALSGPNRVIVTSAARNEESYKGPMEDDGIRGGEFFLEEFFLRLGRGDAFQDAFTYAAERTKLYTRRGGGFVNDMDAVQNPQIDRNGDGRGHGDLNAETGDGVDLSKLYLGAGSDFDSNYGGNPADILGVTPTIFLSSEETRASLFIDVNNARSVGQAPVEIRLPGTELSLPGASAGSAEQRELPETAVIRIPGDLICTQFADRRQCKREVDLFKDPGKYELYYFVTDSETGDISPMRRSVVYKAKENNPPPAPFNLLLPADGAETRFTVWFDWETSFDPEGVSYTFLLATDGKNFDNAVVHKQEELLLPAAMIDRNTRIEDGRIDGSAGLQDLTTYYWKVEAADPYGAKTASPIFSFKTDDTNLVFGGCTDAALTLNTGDTDLNGGCPWYRPKTGILRLPVVTLHGLSERYTVTLQGNGGSFTLDTEIFGETFAAVPDMPPMYRPATRQLHIPALKVIGICSPTWTENNIRMRWNGAADPIQFWLESDSLAPEICLRTRVD